ncbi:MAG: hypothetical protein A3F67_04315 [Verrucomicrobia bacterium RIFCSPHIGHO2_12_FULL_41_10]|nr:MAG: hypothetical protein A3F67_04315 [Verrucomicrobia bacterium RIFCSPHIGHO2_12_FULL_41_10]
MLPPKEEGFGRLSFYLLASLLAVFVYFYGLGSDHLATNGDELVYAQITRATAQSGHLLPLQSPIARLQNTKPPLLFWQGIISTQGAKNWSLANLRYPNVVYTLLTALMLFSLGKKLSGTWESAFLAFLIYLSFFGIYRYGRCFLTSGPEIFWCFLPFFVLLYWPQLFNYWNIIPVFGSIIGLGLLYKSFALVAPVSLGLAWWYLHTREYQFSVWLKRDTGKILLLVLIALGVFSLWFVFDPYPQAVFNNFIVKENLGKFDAGAGNYLLNFFWGNSSIWRNVIAYPFNAGLLAPATIALVILGYLSFRQKNLSNSDKLLWIWVITVFVFFSFPNQRDERYLLLGMPALALLLALHWNRIPRWIMAITLLAVAVITLGLGGLSLILQHDLALETWSFYHYSIGYWFLLALTVGLMLAGLLKPHLTASLACPGTILLYLCYALFLAPFDGPLGRFDQVAQEAVLDKKIWVPTNFNAREESYRFLLPEAKALIPYDYNENITISEMQAKVPRFIISLPLTNTSGENLQGAHILGRRLNLIDRFNAKETRAILSGKIAKYLFHQDLLIER